LVPSISFNGDFARRHFLAELACNHCICSVRYRRTRAYFNCAGIFHVPLVFDTGECLSGHLQARRAAPFGENDIRGLNGKAVFERHINGRIAHLHHKVSGNNPPCTQVEEKHFLSQRPDISTNDIEGFLIADITDPFINFFKNQFSRLISYEKSTLSYLSVHYLSREGAKCISIQADASHRELLPLCDLWQRLCVNAELSVHIGPSPI
jgi:hypothetical protein